MKINMKLITSSLLTICLVVLASAPTFAQAKAQGNSKLKEKLDASQQLIIKWKTDASADSNGEKGPKGSKGSKDIKLMIELKNDDVLVNGKPLDEFNDDDLAILKKDILIMDGNTFDLVVPGAPRSAFRGGNWSWSGDGPAVMGYGNSNRAFLGVGTEKVDGGVAINEITAGSAADKAGLKEGDIITKIDAVTISSPEQLSTTIRKYKPESKIGITIKRAGKEQKINTTLGKHTESIVGTYPDMNQDFNFKMDGFMDGFPNGQPKLGIKAQDTEDGKGVEILEVDDESPAEKAGLKEGDIITSFDGAEVNSVGDLVDRTNMARETKKYVLPVKFLRENKEQQVDLKMPRKLRTAEL